MVETIPNINYYGKSISIIIIYLVVFVSLLIIIDEILNITKFCYKYTYLYNYGNLNEKMCNNNLDTSILEYEKPRFRIYSIINNYKLKKDLFNKNWINYLSYLIISILTIILFILFGILFYFYFINNNYLCSSNIDTNNEDNMSFLKLIIKCMFEDLHKYIPNCTVNYIVLFIIIIIYPLIYIIKTFFKSDYTWNGGTWTKTFHILFCILLLYYIYVLMNETYTDDKTINNKDKIFKIITYISYLIIFYISQYIYTQSFNDYNNLYKTSNIYNDITDKNDTTFFSIYKQEEPIKPIEPKILKEHPRDAVNKDLLISFKYKTNDELKLLSEIEKNNYSSNLNKLTNYYNIKNQYDNNLKIYNDTYNIYKNTNIQFPNVIYMLSHMFPKLIGLDKSIIILIFFIIISFIIIYTILKYYNNENSDYYYTILIYLIGIITILILSNSILTYNTYFNKYHIYEPISQYKFDINKLNILFDLSINNNSQSIDNKLEFYKKITNSDTNIGSGITVNTISDNNIEINYIKKNIYLTETNKTLYINNIDNNSNALKNRNAINIALFSSLLYINDIKRENNIYINYNNFYKTDTNFDFFYLSTNKIINNNPLVDTNNYITNDIKTFFQIIKGTFLNDLNLLDNKLINIKNNIKYLIYNDFIKLTISNINNDNFYFDLLYKNDKTTNELETIDNSNSNDLINTYKNNIININEIVYYYGEFLVEIRNIFIKLFNSSSIYCDKSNIININIKLNQYIKQLFIKINSNNYKFKNSTDEPKIEIYKKILINTINEFNDIYNKYFNIIRFLLIKTIKTSTSDLDINSNKIIQEIINNYNIYNSGNLRYTKSNLINKFFTLECKDYINKYNKLTLKDKNDLNNNINNISSSFIILVIIFAIILIEPTII